jgi:competence protein ComEA
MSSELNLAEVRDGENEPGEARHYAVAETWPVGARALLAVAAFAMAIGLLTVSWDAGTSSRKSFAVAPNLVLDPNSAPPQVLEALPTLGPTLVRRWVAARAQRPISSLADARRRVRGLGPASLSQIAPYLRFEPRPVAPADGVEGRLAAGTKRKSIETVAIDRERVDRLIGRR